MNYAKLIALLLLTLTGLSSMLAPRSLDKLRGVAIGEAVPEYELTTLTGETTSSRRLRGKTVVLIYLSAEQRGSERAAVDASAVLAELDLEDIELVFVTADVVYKAYFEKLWKESSLSAPLALDGQRKLYRKLGLIVFPTTLVIDAEGNLSHVISTRGSDYPFVLKNYVLNTSGRLSNDELETVLTAQSFDQGSPKTLASRHRAAARLLSDKGLVKGAEEELLKAIELDPANIYIRLDLADLLLRTDRIEESARLVSEAREADPRNLRALSLAGIVLYSQGQLEEARVLLESSLELNPDPARSHYYLGRVFEDVGDKGAAMVQYRQAAEGLLGE
jgi:tetratricopeptide (TPR) repeat protein